MFLWCTNPAHDVHDSVILGAISGFCLKVTFIVHILVIFCLALFRVSLKTSAVYIPPRHIYFKESSSVLLPPRLSESFSLLPALPILPGYEVTTEGPEQRMGCSHLNLNSYSILYAHAFSCLSMSRKNRAGKIRHYRI